VVLLSVDPGYFAGDKSYVGRAEKILRERKLTWHNFFLTGGWDEAQRTFNLSGYGKLLVDRKGIVRGVNLHGAELDRLVRQVVAEPSESDGGK
jgi:hypothetical protein